jgi:hypothetical protein
MIKLLACVLLLGTGDFKERKNNEHLLTLSTYNYEQLKWSNSVINDPEVRFRLKRVAYVKWVEETAEKYSSAWDSHEKLRDEDFEKDWK